MSSKYKFKNQDGLYFITYTVINWTDVFTKNSYKDLMIESEKLFDKSFNYNRTLEESWDYQFAKKHHKLDVKPKIVEKINPKNKEIKPKKGNDKGPEI